MRHKLYRTYFKMVIQINIVKNQEQQTSRYNSGRQHETYESPSINEGGNRNKIKKKRKTHTQGEGKRKKGDGTNIRLWRTKNYVSSSGRLTVCNQSDKISCESGRSVRDVKESFFISQSGTLVALPVSLEEN